MPESLLQCLRIKITFMSLKRRQTCFLCPVKVKYRLMGQVYQRFATDLRNCPTDAEIHQRVKSFGPVDNIGKS